MKNKRFALAIITAFTCMLLGGCGSSSDSGEAIVLKAGFSTGASDPRVVATQLFKDEVESATDGRITVEIHTDGELGSDSELISGVVNGEVDITASSAGNFASYAPQCRHFGVPLPFR